MIQRQGFIAIIILYYLVGMAYVWATPLFEASDEFRHFGMVNYIRENHNLPIQDPDNLHTPYHQEGSQPPFYYMVAALLASPFDFSNVASITQENPHAKLGLPHVDDNKNMVLHDAHVPPLKGAVLAAYLLRMIGLIFGAITLTFVYLTAQAATQRKDIALFAMGITAFNPMFVFIMAAINNDTLVTALNSIVIFLVVWMLRDGFVMRRSVLLSILIALATLTKLSGLVMVPVAALSALLVAYRRRDVKGLMTLGILMAGTWSVLAGWWYVRNIQLYGELFGTRMMVNIFGARLEPFTLHTLLAEFEGFRITYWAAFGSVNILTHPMFYIVMDVIVGLAILGVAIAFYRHRRTISHRIILGVLCLTILIGAISLVQWTAQTMASQGRLMFPYMAASSTLLAVGLSEVIRSSRIRIGMISAFAIYALITPFVWIAPRYAPPQPLAHLPESAIPVYSRYGDVELIGYEADFIRYSVGDAVPITLYWRPLATSTEDYSLFLHLLDASGNVIGKIDTYPSGGLRRTTTWQPEVIYADSYYVPLDSGVDAFDLRLLVGWWNYPTGKLILPQNESGESIPMAVLDVGGFASLTVELEGDNTHDEMVFGDAIRLRAYQFEQDELVLFWQIERPIHENYTVFVHVLDENDTLLAQADNPPQLSTRYWQAHEIYQTRHAIRQTDFPDDMAYRLMIGWYRATDFSRLSTQTPDDAYVLLQVD